MATTVKSAKGKKTSAAHKTAAKKTSGKKQAAGTKKSQNCWPGFEPTPGKKPGTKGSCKPVPGKHSKATKRATQKFAAADKLGKEGKPNPKSK